MLNAGSFKVNVLAYESTSNSASDALISMEMVNLLTLILISIFITILKTLWLRQIF